MSGVAQVIPPPAGSAQVEALPDDVVEWLRGVLHPDERVAACLFADITSDGSFGESWVFLTDRRLIVMSPNGRQGEAAITFDLPLEAITGAEIREYVGSSGLVISTEEKGYEVAHFSLGSHYEAADLCNFLRAIVEGRGSGKSIEELRPAATRRPEHRCPKCGRALRRGGEVCLFCIDRRQVLSRLLRHVMPYKWLALLGLSLTFVITGLGLTPPYLTKTLIDKVITPANLSLFPVIVLALVGSHVGSAAVSMFRMYLMQWLGNRVLLDLRVELYDHLQMLRLSYYNRNQTGQIMARVTGDLNRLQQFITEGFQEILVNIVTMILIAVILLLLDWRLFLLALAPTPLIFLATYLFGKYIHALYHRIWRRWAGLSAILADTIPGIRVVKSFAQERRESDRFGVYSTELMRQEMMAVKLQSGFFPFLRIMTALGSILILTVGGYMVVKSGGKDPTLGTLVAFTGYLMQFYTPVQQFGRINHTLQRCVTSAERVFEVLDTDPEPVGTRGGVVLDPLKGRVEFNNVRFSYEPGKYALDGVSFCVEPGEMIGLVGPSGAGKSTTVHMIARFYDVDEGSILIDGIDIEDLDLTAFRQQIGVVLQDPYLFHGTVWSNIAYSRPDATADEIIEAAKAANSHDFIMRLPDGYDTIIGERGQTLSGGERQRISIARAILRDPCILILDEATASVDTETEALIQAALERLVQNRTTFAIAHRLSTLRKATRLFVLERGKLVESGTHAELIESGGLYSRLCKLQSELSQMKAW
ncbi:MAG: ABC transporter ATP-binding protein [Candidatus Brocadiaceae bacterium]|nr:ABC transporter ATP-binding protein [Candidatus Brocadiaceae bacterium]